MCPHEVALDALATIFKMPSFGLLATLPALTGHTVALPQINEAIGLV